MKKILKFYSIIAFFAIIGLLFLACNLDNDDYTDSAYFSWEVWDGKITITGYIGPDTVINIPPQINGFPVTSIGRYALAGGKDIEWIEVFNEDGSMEWIGIPTGLPCGTLHSVIIPNSVTSIEDYAFFRNQLTNVTIGNNVTFIGNYAFYENHLTNVTIPNSVTFVGDYAFCDNQLTSVIIGNKVTIIRNGTFLRNQLTSVEIGNNVKNIEWGAFLENQLTNITIPNSVTTIGDAAFAQNQLSKIVIPNNVTNIGGSAFYDNKLTSITIGANVELSAGHAWGSFGNNGFENTYNDGGRLAGTYTRPNIESTIWKR